jgi:hypothetical protein
VSSDWKKLYGPLVCGLHLHPTNSSEEDIDRMLAQDPDRFKNIYTLALDQTLPTSQIATSFPQVVTLYLGESAIVKSSQDAFASLSALSALTALQALTVETEHLGPELVDVVLEAMVARQQRQTLTRLDLGGSYVSSDCMSEQGLQSLRSLASGLESVRLGLAADDLRSFCNALGSLTRLTQLSVNGGFPDGIDEADLLESSDKLSALTNMVDLHVCDWQGSALFMRAALNVLPCLNIRRLHLDLEEGSPDDFETIDADFHHIGSLHRTLTSLQMALVSGHSFAGFVGQLTALEHLDLSEADSLGEQPEFPQCLTLLPPSLRHLALPMHSRDYSEPVADALVALKAAADARGHALHIGRM